MVKPYDTRLLKYIIAILCSAFIATAISYIIFPNSPTPVLSVRERMEKYGVAVCGEQTRRYSLPQFDARGLPFHELNATDRELLVEDMKGGAKLEVPDNLHPVSIVYIGRLRSDGEVLDSLGTPGFLVFFPTGGEGLCVFPTALHNRSPLYEELAERYK